MIEKILNLGVLATLPFAASAIIAYPDPVDITQPDGSVITLLIRGDEKHHICTTEDGHMLLKGSDGFYRYASADATGNLVPSGPVAHNIAERNVAELRHISATNSSEILSLADNMRLQNISRKTLKMNIQRAMDNMTAPEKGVGLVAKAFPNYGEPRACVVLVEYQDVRFDVDNPGDYFKRMLNEEDFSDNGATGSARDFFVSNSNGIFKPQFDVYGPILLKGKRADYGGNTSYGDDCNAEGMIIEACQQLDSTVDFSVYDHDGDGYIDNVFAFYAGGGEHDKGGGEDAVWPHAANMTEWVETPYIFDGVRLDSYGCTCETPAAYNRPDGIGTFVHEFSHVMGLPDLYTTVYNTAFTPGPYSCMDTGPYNNQGRTPPNYSSFERTALGWMKATRLGAEGVKELPELTSSNFAYIIPSDSPNEFYLLENRQQKGNDAYIPGHGMIVWHIDYDEKIWEHNTVNNTPLRQRVDLIEANNQKTKNDRSGHTFPGKDNITEFGFNTRPALKFVFPTTNQIELTNISEADGVISFLYTDPFADPNSAVEEIGGENVNIINVCGKTITAGQDCTVYDASGINVAYLRAGQSFDVPSHGLYFIKSQKSTIKTVL